MTAARWPYIETASGHLFPLVDPEPDDFKIEDIACHLSKINRYTGAHQLDHYSVAEHSVRVAFYLEALVAREFPDTCDDLMRRAAIRTGLLHDASEAYLNDLSSPLKKVPEIEGYNQLERKYQDILSKRYNLHEFMAQGVNLVREADIAVLDEERKVMMTRKWPRLAQLPPVDMGFKAWGWTAAEARAVFLLICADLGVVE